MFSWITAILVTLSYIVIDALYASYTIHIQKGNAKTAASVGASMYALMAYGIMTFTAQPIYVIFVFIGSWIGTYTTVQFYNHKKYD